MILLSFLVWFVASVVTLWGTWYALRQFNRDIPEPSPKDLVPVSVLKPLKGAECGMEQNIESFFQLDYPRFELLFCIADASDPGCEVVRRLMAKHPSVDATLHIGEIPVGPNPKINNIYGAYQEAKFDHLVISDSNVRVAPDYLKRLSPQLAADVGVVTSVVAGTHAGGTGGFLEAAYLNTFYARWMQISAKLGVPCVVGKSMMFRRSVAKRFGGIHILGRYINEDYMTGRAMMHLGYKVRIHPDPINQYIGEYSLQAFWSRHIRWGRIRKSQAPVAFYAEPLVSFLGSALIGVYGVTSVLGVSPWHFLAGHFAIWSLCDLLLMRRLGAGQNLRMFFGWCLREVVALPLWVHIASGNTVNWRGSRLTLKSGGILSPAGSRASCA